MDARLDSSSGLRIRPRVTCPHCWNIFPPARALYIAQHPSLLGDPKLGADQPQRFLPTRFTLEGAALDAQGFPCHELACPKCHLPVPRVMCEMPPLFVSILGAPACGKSYFLASMTWQLRQVLVKHFAIAFSDADPLSNHRLQEYESLHFLNPDRDSLVAIEKTETHGDLYDTVLFGEQAVSYPRPFMFSLAPLESHPNFVPGGGLSRVLCMYDNAGESFLPGADSAASPVTRHLAQSAALLFLFDPTQDLRFRQACRGKTDDPQMERRTQRLQRESPIRQDTILIEAAERVRRFAGLARNAKHSRPLVLVVTKCDCWASLLDDVCLDWPWITDPKTGIGAMRLDRVDCVSQKLRALLWRLAPEVVSAAEGFAQRVIYVPVSATGTSPEADPRTGVLGIRPRNIRPVWVEVPLLYAMSRWMQGLIAYTNASLPRADRVRVVPKTAESPKRT